MAYFPMTEKQILLTQVQHQIIRAIWPADQDSTAPNQFTEHRKTLLQEFLHTTSLTKEVHLTLLWHLLKAGSVQ